MKSFAPTFTIKYSQPSINSHPIEADQFEVILYGVMVRAELTETFTLVKTSTK